MSSPFALAAPFAALAEWAEAQPFPVRPADIGAMPVALRERLGYALHDAVHPRHTWSGCTDPDAVYDEWMVRFLNGLAEEAP